MSPLAPEAAATPDLAGVRELEVQLLLEAIYRQYHCDFRQYSLASINRRIDQALQRFSCATVSALQERALHDPAILPQLVQMLTVQVSDMFRDPHYFLELRNGVLPTLATYPSLRIWIAGCSTGEEAYSLAILLAEEGLLDRSTLYATDINTDSLRRAESGVFDLSRLRQFTENHRLSGARSSLSDHYHAARGSAVMAPELKRHITFSDHSLATDQVFSEMQLVSCRNVLIYFNRELQHRALGLFRDSLCPRGFLGLGSQETLRFTGYEDTFSEIAPSSRLYRKRT
jgi:chemotaxis protein methyltransferase CheR